MRNFSWGCFQVTGSIDAYLLFKDMEGLFIPWDEQQKETKHEEDVELESN